MDALKEAIEAIQQEEHLTDQDFEQKTGLAQGTLSKFKSGLGLGRKALALLLNTYPERLDRPVFDYIKDSACKPEATK